MEYIHPAAWWGMLELVVPALVDRVVEGNLVPGLAVHLRAAVGSEWRNGEARYRALLRYEVAPCQRLRLAERSEAAWNEMRDEVGAANGDAVVDGVKSVLCVQAEFSLGARRRRPARTARRSTSCGRASRSASCSPGRGTGAWSPPR